MNQSAGVKIKKSYKNIKNCAQDKSCFTLLHTEYLVTWIPNLHIKNHLIGVTQQSGYCLNSMFYLYFSIILIRNIH